MRKVEENLTQEEFENYCEDVRNRMESETTYFGQMDETVAYSGDLKVKHIYGDENDEHESVLYEEKYNEENDTLTYDIWED